jgi:hypothetical protein
MENAGSADGHYPRGMPDFSVEPYAPEDMLRFEPREVRLNKAPKQGSWFELDDGTPAQVKAVRIIGGEPVIYVHIGGDDDRRRLKQDKRR